MQTQTERAIELRIRNLTDSKGPVLWVDDGWGAWLCLNQEGHVYTSKYREGQSMPPAIRYGVTVTWELPPTVRNNCLRWVLMKEETLNLLERVYQGLGSEYDEHGNLVGTLTEDASEAEDLLKDCFAEYAWDDHDLVDLWQAEDWIWQSPFDVVWPAAMTLAEACEALLESCEDEDAWLSDEDNLAEALLDKLLRDYENGSVKELSETQRAAVLASGEHTARLAEIEDDESHD